MPLGDLREHLRRVRVVRRDRHGRRLRSRVPRVASRLSALRARRLEDIADHLQRRDETPQVIGDLGHRHFEEHLAHPRLEELRSAHQFAASPSSPWTTFSWASSTASTFGRVWSLAPLSATAASFWKRSEAFWTAASGSSSVRAGFVSPQNVNPFWVLFLRPRSWAAAIA